MGSENVLVPDVACPLGIPCGRDAVIRFALADLLPDELGAEVRGPLRQAAARINKARQAGAGTPVSAAGLISAALLHEALRVVFRRYCEVQRPGSLGEGVRRVSCSMDETGSRRKITQESL